MWHSTFVSFSKEPGALDLTNARILVDEADHKGVKIAATMLSEDVARVTKGPSNTVEYYTGSTASVGSTPAAIIVGCIESSRLLQELEKAGKVEFTGIRGKWECFCTSLVADPLPGCDSALVIAGSDKRGAIYGIYTLSEQLGVSPWYWWADVPPKHHPNIYAQPTTTTSQEPSIRYRGIFINDEAPALTGWVRAKFGGYNVQFYQRVFELLLRLRANFLWPAMWPGYPNPGASFFTDDGQQNQSAADEWGIVVSTSHHEPMQRLANEWLAEDNPLGTWDWLTNKDKITAFFDAGVKRAAPFESYLTLGMRGEYDTKMRTDDPAAVVQDVLQVQRSLIKGVHGREDAVPQLLALYKEVQAQFDSGRLEVADDVTLLFSDDNFGSIRRLPRGEEARREGGCGLYYHLEYVGTPRSYKWINSNSLGKVWHQLREAHRRGARQIWVFNVGDIKPLEVPLTFAMTLAWDVESASTADDDTNDGIHYFLRNLANREFGPLLSQDIARAWLEYDRLVSLRRHEHIEPTTFSLLHHNEAELIISRWQALLAQAEQIYARSPSEQKPSVFQLVLHPIKASALFTSLQITVARNQLHARQRRNSTNTLAARALALFSADFDLAEEYHGLLGGKWNHILSQPHWGFESDTWHAPSRDMLAGLCYVQTRQASNPIAGHMGIMVEGHEGVRPGLTNENSDFTHPSKGDLVVGLTLGVMTRYGPARRWVELFTRGTCVVHWTAQVLLFGDLVRLSRMEGTLLPGKEGEEDQRLEVEVAWDHVPTAFDETVIIEFRSDEGDLEHVHLPINCRRVPDTFQEGFVEDDGYIVIPPTACKQLGPCYYVLPSTGRTPWGSIALDPASQTSEPPAWLEYKFFTFSDPGPTAEAATARSDLVLHFNMTLDLDPDSLMQYEFSIDGSPFHRHRLLDIEAVEEGDPELPSPIGWVTAVQDCAWRKLHDVRSHLLGTGEHSLRLRLLHTNMLLESILLDFGGVKESYLAPPPSSHLRSGNFEGVDLG
ncbi:hypothetical protein M406DRAFT_39649 [Cryphonectria parasitica EP155]|uniref:Gylcosyl hydrolase 115 C-terminal domain-containing protein n=1 Tax=Cryphonectria parasitica (strain ATCC 38755 / EP155) TaxID=660469 RepID=A0A9P4Y6R0_CRYP1|nr:uncharacterized protein M406DRAFT_39649 [Cryphonectria parasitica EP155]KAF3767947.1 hypothetical protein M406DRAFT_39649 [Cryphonectria parasitica EP155]